MNSRIQSLTFVAIVSGCFSILSLRAEGAELPGDFTQAQTNESGTTASTEQDETVSEKTMLDSAQTGAESGIGVTEELDDFEALTQDIDVSQDIDERFETEGYIGGYLALLQQTVPTFGFTGSIFLDDDLRFGLDVSIGDSEIFFGSFKTRGAAIWTAWEISDSYWSKLGVSYSKLDRINDQEPLSVLTKGVDKSKSRTEIRNDSLGVDFGFGQLWSGSKVSIAVDYIGFTVPLLRLTGKKLPTYSLQLARFAALYNIE